MTKVPCAGCTRANAVDRKFCGGCGLSLAAICGSCAFANEADDRFCGGCGGALVATGARPRPHPAGAAVTSSPIEPLRLDAIDLVELFRPYQTIEEPDLPASGIGQGDLDRLFEVTT